MARASFSFLREWIFFSNVLEMYSSSCSACACYVRGERGEGGGRRGEGRGEGRGGEGKEERRREGRGDGRGGKGEGESERGRRKRGRKGGERE